MGVVEGPVWMEHVHPTECRHLLSLAPVGRVGVLVDSAPEIYPVNHVVDDRMIVFRTDGGTRLRSLDRSPSVCFEADGMNLDDRTGWSVLVKGRAVVLSDPEEVRRATELPLRFWALGPKTQWVRIVPAEVTGRRIGRM
jgi:nitroimidazol reductase NimA-like FMN-containing flavoprotein (pyridoxamine 5'-phosphate oxidase superfamily)